MVSEQVHRLDGTDQRRRIEDGKEGIAEDRDPQGRRDRDVSRRQCDTCECADNRGTAFSSKEEVRPHHPRGTRRPRRSPSIHQVYYIFYKYSSIIRTVVVIKGWSVCSASLASLTRETGPNLVTRKSENERETKSSHHHYTAPTIAVSDSALKFTHVLYNLSPAGI